VSIVDLNDGELLQHATVEVDFLSLEGLENKITDVDS
jgi:hypothetical protein